MKNQSKIQTIQKELNKRGFTAVALAVFAVLLILVPAGTSWAVERNCEYEIRVKSNAEGINSMVIPGGVVISNGDFSSAGGPHESSARQRARWRASDAAKACFRAAWRSTGNPRECRINDNPSHNNGAMKRYNITNLAAVARETICSEARRRGLQRVRDYEVYAMVKGSGDVQNECSYAFNWNNYYTIARGTNLNCTPEQETRYSGWYDKSATEMRAVVNRHCRNNRSGARGRINHFEINRNDGRIRAHFTCY